MESYPAENVYAEAWVSYIAKIIRMDGEKRRPLLYNMWTSISVR